MVRDTTLGNPGACETTQNPADCPLDVNNIKDGLCLAGVDDLTGKTRAELDAGLRRSVRRGLHLPDGQADARSARPIRSHDECATSQLHCGTPEPKCAAPEGTPHRRVQ